MKHLHTFESFLNEGANHGDITSAIGGGDNRAFANFFNKAKKGDTFMYSPNGVDLDYIEKSDLGKDTAEVMTSTSSRDAKPTNCTVLLVRDGVALSGGSMEWSGDEEEAVLYYTIDGDDKIYVMTNVF
jgi:hypothetical protein